MTIGKFLIEHIYSNHKLDELEKFDLLAGLEIGNTFFSRLSPKQ